MGFLVSFLCMGNTSSPSSPWNNNNNNNNNTNNSNKKMNLGMMEAKELTTLLRNQVAKHSPLLVIDVRDDYHHGGHFIASRNIPSASFDAQLPFLVQELQGNPDVTMVIFHCFYSQVRGPAAARRFHDAWMEQDE